MCFCPGCSLVYHDARVLLSKQKACVKALTIFLLLKSTECCKSALEEKCYCWILLPFYPPGMQITNECNVSNMSRYYVTEKYKVITGMYYFVTYYTLH